MMQQTHAYLPASSALEMYQPQADVLYSLDATARLAAVPRRVLLVYCRARLVQPVLLPPFGMMAFTEEAIYTVRRIEHLRAMHRCDLAWLNTVFDLLNEVERLRAEVRFFRNA
jgi:hypothetical protein